MSQAQFDAYLSQLAKSLKLRKARSADLADELSDHLDARLEELLAQGKSRDEAIRLALEEFGDAPQLAQEFSRLAKSRQRKFVMRCTAASSVVVAGVLFVAVSLMPVAPEGPGAAPLTGQEPPAEAIASSNPGEESVEQEAIAALDRKLSQAVKVDFSDVPLRQVIVQLAEQIKADVIFDEQAIEEEGLTIDNAPTLKFEHAQVTARTAFEFLVEPEGLAVANRSGVLFVTSMSRAEELLVIKVYNVRDLIEQAAPSYATPPMDGMGGMGGGGFFSIQDHIATAVIAGQVAQIDPAIDPAEDEKAGAMGGGMSGIGMGGMGGATGRREPPVADSPEQRAALALAQLIQELTGGPWFEIDGQGGSVRSFHGLLVVRQTEETHNEIRKLLDGLREANQSGPGSSVTVPEGDAPAEEQTESGSGLRDLSVLGEFTVTPDARAALVGIEPDASGEISQLEALRAITLTKLPSRNTFMAYYVMQSLGIEWSTWQLAINRAESKDQPLGDLKTLLDAAKKHAGDQPIDAEHLLLALLDYKDGPIPAVLAHVGLTPEGLREKISKPESGQAPDRFEQPWEYKPYKDEDDEENESSSTDSRQPLDKELFDTARQSGVSIKVTQSETDSSFGSGMIISSKKDETLILTAWHPFRGQMEDSEIIVSMPSPRDENLDEEFPAEFVAGNEEADLALLLVDRQIKRPVAVIGAMEDLPDQGDPVICIANGVQQGPRILPQQVESTNPFSGPSTIACTGPPVTPGSSGAGLFTRDKRLVGICFAYEKDGSRNIYSGLSSIHEFLKEVGHGDLVPASNKIDKEKADSPSTQGAPVYE